MAEAILYQPRHSRIIWSASWLFLLTAIYAVSQRHYDLAIGPAGIFLTSVNYWRHPVHGLRRNIDIGFVWIATTYQLTRALTAEHGAWFYIGYVVAFSCYPVSNHLLQCGRHFESALLHAGLHLFSNISNIVLFSGTVEDTVAIARIWMNDTWISG